MESNLSITIQSSTIFRILGSIIILLVLANILAICFQMFGHEYVYGFVPKFHLDNENNIPTYFSSLMLLIAATLLGAISVLKKRTHDVFSSYWMVLSLIFLYLSVDETASLHEILNSPLRHTFNLSGILYFSWVIIGAFLIILFLLFYYRFFLHLPKSTKIRFLLAAFFYICGAFGFELLGGYYLDRVTTQHTVDLIYNIITTFEETFELIGTLVLINALVKYIERYMSRVVLCFK